MGFYEDEEDPLSPFMSQNDLYASNAPMPKLGAMSMPPETMSTDSVAQAPIPTEAPVAQPKPDVTKYIADKYGLGKYSDENRQKIVDQNTEDASGPNWAAALGALGAGLQGKDSISAGQSILKSQADARKGKLSSFDEGRDNILKDAKAKNEMQAFDDKSALHDREQDMNSKESELARSLLKRMAPDFDSSQMSAAQINEKIPSLSKIYDIEQRKLDRQEARAERRDLFGARKEEREEGKRQKMQDREDSLAIPGYERTGEVLPKPEEAAKLRMASANADQMQTKLSRLKDLVKQNGSFEYGGKDGTEMESLATEIQLLSKSPEMYQLGVLSGPDMKLLEKITADPASLNSMFTLDSSRGRQIDTQMKSIANKLSAVTKASGYRKSGGGMESSSDLVSVRAPNGKTKKIPRSDLQSALDNGGQLIDQVGKR